MLCYSEMIRPSAVELEMHRWGTLSEGGGVNHALGRQAVRSGLYRWPSFLSVAERFNETSKYLINRDSQIL